MSEALRLADEYRASMNIDTLHDWAFDAAAELRRLHALNAELVEALKLARSIIGHPGDAHTQMIDAAIAKATGEQT